MTETSHLICSANQLTGFYVMVTLAFNELNPNLIKISKIVVHKFGPEYKHSLLREGPLVEQEASNTALILVVSFSSRITGLCGR